ncbi:hypothetical protein [Actinoallomurus sp. NPDC052274]|uniref:hypothetical protein n=1 Tax=Actinoallomurus sp. NPDC052274 TaxID=3155420 RepID=UPI0034474DEF
MATAALALVLIVLARRAYRAAASSLRLAVRGRQPEDLLTIVVAAVATTVVATGMWKFADRVLHFPLELRVLLFSFIELAQMTSAVRARRTMREEARKAAADPTYEPRGAGPDGIAVWVLTCASAVLSTIDSDSFAEGVFRTIAPLVSAWLWHRGMSVELRRISGRKGYNWRITPERLFVWLGIAEPIGRTTDEVDAHRRLHRVARRAKHLRDLEARGARAWRQDRAERRLDRVMADAVEYAALATDPERQAALLAQIAALYNAGALADLDPESPWMDPVMPPQLRLIRLSEVGPEVRRRVGAGVPDDVPDEAAKQPEPPADDEAAGREEQQADDEPRGVPEIDPEELERLVRKARRKFGRALAAGTTPSIGTLKSALRIGQDKATAVKAALAVPEEELGA